MKKLKYACYFSLVTLSVISTLSPEKFGMKVGMLVGALFPLAGIFLSVILRKKAKNKGENL